MLSRYIFFVVLPKGSCYWMIILLLNYKGLNGGTQNKEQKGPTRRDLGLFGGTLWRSAVKSTLNWLWTCTKASCGTEAGVWGELDAVGLHETAAPVEQERRTAQVLDPLKEFAAAGFLLLYQERHGFWHVVMEEESSRPYLNLLLWIEDQWRVLTASGLQGGLLIILPAFMYFIFWWAH